METMQDVIGKLNEFLTAEVLDKGLLEGSVNRFATLCEPKPDGKEGLPNSVNHTFQSGIVLMDFEMHSEEKQEEFRLLKVENIHQQNFELAANMRDEERECEIYQKFTKNHGLDQSAFVLLPGCLIYAYFGTAKNDQMIRGILEMGEGLKSVKIN